jgi:apolipoprotein N-acyltransferase
MSDGVRWFVETKGVGLACASGMLVLLAFPSFEMAWLAWMGLVPLLVALKGRSLKGAFLLSCMGGIVFYAGTFYGIWSGSVAALKPIHFVILGAYFSLYWGLWGLGVNWIGGKTGLSTSVIAPPLWVALEAGRSHLSFLSYPWLLLGHSQYLDHSLLQIASITGVYGITFLIVLMNAAIAEAVGSVRGWFVGASPSLSVFGQSAVISLGAASLLLMASHFYGEFILSKGIEGERKTIALVQGNIPKDRLWNRTYLPMIVNRYGDLTKMATMQSTDLVIWPESAVPGDLVHELGLQRTVGHIATETNTPLLVGTSQTAKFANKKLRDKYYNSMVLINPDGQIAAEYRKMVLVPFGEYEPLKGVVQWPRVVVASSDSTIPGDRYTIFTIGGTSFGALICWENIFPDHFREFVKRGARFMVVATNEAWFGDTAAPHQLLAISAFRAAENRVAIARSANTGISAFIDPFGRITGRVSGANGKDLFVEGVLVGEITVSRERTFYTRYGDLFAFLMIAVCFLALFHIGRRKADHLLTAGGRYMRGGECS